MDGTNINIGRRELAHGTRDFPDLWHLGPIPRRVSSAPQRWLSLVYVSIALYYSVPIRLNKRGRSATLYFSSTQQLQDAV